jgi:hypothetical protein
VPPRHQACTKDDYCNKHNCASVHARVHAAFKLPMIALRIGYTQSVSVSTLHSCLLLWPCRGVLRTPQDCTPGKC